MEKSVLVKCEPACPSDTDVEPANFVAQVRNAGDIIVKVESWTSAVAEDDTSYARTEDVTTLESVQLASGMKQETKLESTEPGSTLENICEPLDIKDEIFTEEHTVDQLEPAIKEENNVVNLVKLTKGSLHNCDSCSKSFSRRSHLLRHVLVHTGVRPYSCTECSRKFSQKVGLKRHMLIHNEKRPYRCTDCPRAFREMCQLNEHRSTHTGERPYSCNDCKNTYSRKSYLKAHVLTHTGERLHCCTLCGSSFALRTSLKKHMLTHSAVKSYVCTVCQTSFSRRFSLKRHLATHCKKAEPW